MAALVLICIPLLAAADPKKSPSPQPTPSSTPEEKHVYEEPVCPATKPKIPEISRSEVYKDVPFKSGEVAKYKVSFGVLHAGYATMEVRPPILHSINGKSVWHRVFHGEAKTGDWFNDIFILEDKVDAFSRPWDFGISYFYLEQREGKLFSKPLNSKKYLDFAQENCKVTEKQKVDDKPEEKNEFDLAYGAIDALGVVYHMRTREYEIGKKQKALVYTSEKNWWLEADPVALETIEIEGKKYDTIKLKLQTYLGKHLQQKGDVYAWMARKGPKELVRVDATVAFGTLQLNLVEFKPGA